MLVVCLSPDTASAICFLWGDLWFFAWNAHRPADLAACGALSGADASRCRAHTRAFVLRAILGELLAPGAPAGLLDRTCRSGVIPETLTAGLYVADPTLDDQVALAAELSCEAAQGRPVRRYNPVFQALDTIDARMQAGSVVVVDRCHRFPDGSSEVSFFFDFSACLFRRLQSPSRHG